MELLKLIEEDHKNARSLQSHCRVVIRCRIAEMGRQTHLNKLIDELPLPTDVKKFVKLEYLWQNVTISGIVFLSRYLDNVIVI